MTDVCACGWLQSSGGSAVRQIDTAACPAPPKKVTCNSISTCPTYLRANVARGSLSFTYRVHPTLQLCGLDSRKPRQQCQRPVDVSCALQQQSTFYCGSPTGGIMWETFLCGYAVPNSIEVPFSCSVGKRAVVQSRWTLPPAPVFNTTAPRTTEDEPPFSAVPGRGGGG